MMIDSPNINIQNTIWLESKPRSLKSNMENIKANTLLHRVFNVLVKPS